MNLVEIQGAYKAQWQLQNVWLSSMSTQKIFKVQLQLGNICINLVATGIFNPYKCIKDKCNICKRKLKCLRSIKYPITK